MKQNIKVIKTENGTQVILLGEPQKSQQENIMGLHRASGAIFRGVNFGRSAQRDLGYFSLFSFAAPGWDSVRDAGGGEFEIDDEKLEELARRSNEIDRIVNSAVPAPLTFRCAGAKDSCGEMVSQHGKFCKSCAFDEFDN